MTRFPFALNLLYDIAYNFFPEMSGSDKSSGRGELCDMFLLFNLFALKSEPPYSMLLSCLCYEGLCDSRSSTEAARGCVN